MVSVTQSFIDLLRTVRRAKARLLAVAGGNDVESATQSLLHAVAAGGPMRASALAASLLAVTDAGRAAIAQHEQGRHAFFADVLAGWSDEELRHFGQQLERFTVAYDHVHAARMKERAARPDSPSRVRTRTAGPQHYPHLEEGSA